ncbi:MAG: FliG C-terminal domain-containing protein, partial [Novosphingobium sp.]|nr:FliG C-terminal domain-containing protein [Novosphingobium sp.]
ELKVLGERMCALGEIEPSMIARTVEDFLARTDRVGMPAADRAKQVETLMTGAVGEMKAGNLMRSILPPASRKQSSLELVKWLDVDTIATLIEGEHPQVIAVLLIQLDPQVAAKVLHSLEAQAQSEVVHRIATLGGVSPEALSMLEQVLEQKIAQNQTALPLQLGGPTDAAEIINKSGKSVEKQIMTRLAKVDRVLARQIEAEMFRFEHLFVLDSQSMGALLREVESETLVDALKGIGESEREYFFAAMSARAADGVRDEIDARGRVKMAEVEAAQKDVIDVARRLAADGTIAFGGGDDDYV